MLDLNYPDPVFPGAPKPETTRSEPVHLRPSYRAFVFLLDHWAKVLLCWVGIVGGLGFIAGEYTLVAYAVALPLGLLFLVAAVMILFVVLRRIIGRLLCW